jgi:hypothetical protein
MAEWTDNAVIWVETAVRGSSACTSSRLAVMGTSQSEIREVKGMNVGVGPLSRSSHFSLFEPASSEMKVKCRRLHSSQYHETRAK